MWRCFASVCSHAFISSKMHYTVGTSNYRPVSHTCITCKIMEHIVCGQIGRHLDHNNILHPSQRGFRKGLCCETQLVDTIHELAYSINQKTQIDVIFMDFSKAFDKVSHDKLLHKIRYYVLAVNKLSSTDTHRSQLVYSRESHKEVCWGLCFFNVRQRHRGRSDFVNASVR